MKCPTCDLDLYLIRASRVVETVVLDEDGEEGDVIASDVVSVDDHELRCDNDHSFGVDIDEDDHYFPVMEPGEG